MPESQSIEAAKSALRRSALALRDAMPPEERAAASQALAARAFPAAIEPGVIVSGFIPLKSEIDIRPLMRALADRGAKLALPVVVGRGEPLVMRAWEFGAPLKGGGWGISEPPAAAPEVLPDILLVPLLAIFFLKDGRVFSDVALSVVQSRPQREFLQAVIADMNQMLAQFIRAQLTLAAFSLVVYAGFLGIMGVPYALVLGTAGGVMEFIPVVGPLVAAFLILSVAVLMNYPHWAVLLLFLVVWRVIQDYVISPRVMGKSMELHPLAAIFGVMAGGEMAGVLGVYLSIPVMASLRIVWRRGRIYVEKKRFGPLNEYTFGGEIQPRR